MSTPILPPRRTRRARNGTVERLERKGGTRFAVWYWVDDQRRRELQPAGTSERQARGRLSELMESGRRGELPRAGGSAPFDAYATTWLAERESLVRAGSLKASTYRDNETAVKRHLTPFYGNLPLGELSRADCLAFRAHKVAEGRLAPKTINGLLGTLKLILSHAVDHELIVASPAASVKRLATGQPEMEWYEVGEAERLVAHTPIEWRALIALAAFAGLRQGELLALRWSDIQWSADRLHVRQSLQRRQKLLDEDANPIAGPKTAKGVRVVPILPLVRPHLEHHKQAHARPNDLDLVFSNEDGGTLDSSNVVNRVYLPAVKRAGLHRIRFHDLRHTFVTYCAAAGVPLAKVGDWVGHSDSRITEVYRHASLDSEDFALARLADFDRIRCTNVALPPETTGNDRQRPATKTSWLTGKGLVGLVDGTA